MDFILRLFDLTTWIDLFNAINYPLTLLGTFLFDTIPNWVSRFSGFFTALNSFSDSVIGYFSAYQFGDLTKDLLAGIGNFFVNLGTSISQAFLNAMSTIGEKIKEGFRALVIFDENFWSTLGTKIKEALKGIFK